MEISTKKIPFANPESVSIRAYLGQVSSSEKQGIKKIRAYPYVNLSFGGQVAMTDASRPTAMAKQSKPIWIAKGIPCYTKKRCDLDSATYRQR